MTFPVDFNRCIDKWESIYLASLRYGPDVALMLKPRENQAVHDVYLVKSKA